MPRQQFCVFCPQRHNPHIVCVARNGSCLPTCANNAKIQHLIVMPNHLKDAYKSMRTRSIKAKQNTCSKNNKCTCSTWRCRARVSGRYIEIMWSSASVTSRPSPSAASCCMACMLLLLCSLSPSGASRGARACSLLPRRTPVSRFHFLRTPSEPAVIATKPAARNHKRCKTQKNAIVTFCVDNNETFKLLSSVSNHFQRQESKDKSRSTHIEGTDIQRD